MGTVTGGVGGTPLREVRVDVLIVGDLTPKAAVTDAAGQYEATVTITKPLDKPLPVTLRFYKEGFEPFPTDSIQTCDFRSGPCRVSAIQLAPSGGSSALTEEERTKLDSVKSTEGSTLFMLPYQVAHPLASKTPVNMKTLTDCLHIAISTQIQSLEGDRELARFDPLEPVSLIAIPPEVDIDGTNVERIKTVGHHVNALAVISGNGEVVRTSEASEIINVRSRFVIMPTNGSAARQFLVDDRELPTAVFNSLELAEKLSPQWGHNTVFALCQREFEKAKQAKDHKALWRIRAYVSAQLHRASGDEKLKVGDLQRLLQRIDAELTP